MRIKVSREIKMSKLLKVSDFQISHCSADAGSHYRDFYSGVKLQLEYATRTSDISIDIITKILLWYCRSL